MPRSRSNAWARGADELVDAFSLFLHDVRGPLGAASGSLRLADAERSAPMIANATQALRVLSRLTQQASAWLDALAVDAPARQRVGVDTFTGAVAAALEMTPTPMLADSAAGVALSSTDAVAAAVAVIVREAAAPAFAPDAVAIDVTENEVLVRYGSPDERARLAGTTERLASPFKKAAFMTFAACDTIAAHGGHVWTLEGGRHTVAVAVPLERT